MKNIEEFNNFIQEKKWIKGAIKKEGSLRDYFDKKEGEKITKKEIEKEIEDLKKQDKDKEKEGLQLPPSKAKTYKRLVLARTLGKFENLEYNQETEKETNNYMFFSNIEKVKRMCEELLEMNRSEVDEILVNGHAWAVDHVSTSADDIEEVYNFLKSEIGKGDDIILSEQ